MAVKSTKMAIKIPNIDEIHHTFPSQDLPKFAIFGMIPSRNPSCRKKVYRVKVWNENVDLDVNKGTFLLKCHPNIKQTSTSGKKFLRHDHLGPLINGDQISLQKNCSPTH
jgi:hypothetical protein